MGHPKTLENVHGVRSFNMPTAFNFSLRAHYIHIPFALLVNILFRLVVSLIMVSPSNKLPVPLMPVTINSIAVTQAKECKCRRQAAMTDAQYAIQYSLALSGVVEEWTGKDRNMYQVLRGLILSTWADCGVGWALLTFIAPSG